MKRTELRRRPKPRRTDLDASRAWWVAVTHQKECVITGCGKSYLLHGHHVLAQQVIKKEFPHGHPDGRTLEELRWDKRNGVAICERHHMQHEAGTQRIPAAAIPLAAFRFAEELGLGHRVGPTIYPR